MKIAHWGLGILLVLPLGVAAGRQQSTQQAAQQAPADPVAEAARRAREQKKDQAKPAHVWNNDDIPKTNGVSVVGENPAAEAEASASDAGKGANAATAPAAAANGETTAPAAGQGTGSEKTGAIAADLVAANERLKSLQTDLDIAQRSTPWTSRHICRIGNIRTTTQRRGAKDAEDQIAAKQQEVADAQKEVEELKAKLAASAPPPPPAPLDEPVCRAHPGHAKKSSYFSVNLREYDPRSKKFELEADHN